jgi:hypothetical protein
MIDVVRVSIALTSVLQERTYVVKRTFPTDQWQRQASQSTLCDDFIESPGVFDRLRKVVLNA